jgi:hypothetical protein
VANSGIVLVLDSDEAGQNSAEKSGRNLLDLFSDWGTPRYPGEPVSRVIASLQQAIDELGDEIKGREAAGIDSLVQSEMRWLLFDYMSVLHASQRETLYTSCLTADEYQTAVTIQENPILPQHGTIDFAAIKREVDIVDYISHHAELKRRGRNLVTVCPLPDHNEDTASFYIYPENQSFYCFGCGRGGDVIEYAKLRGVSARELL